MNSGELNVKIKRLLGEMPKRALFRAMRPFANGFILLNPWDRVRRNHVNLDYWKESSNLGDALSPIIVEHLIKERGMSFDTEVCRTRHLCAVGSVITAGAQDCVVWGSGILNPKLLYRIKGREFDVRAVRGPVTRALLMEYGYSAPAAYGDPAVFMSEIYQPKAGRKSCHYGFVVHKDGSARFADVSSLSRSYKFIDIKTDDYRHFIDELATVECVVSTSLHGVILAETYGIPAILMMPECDFMKYEDWYEATGRSSHPVVESLDDLDVIEPPPIPNLDGMRKTLRKAFPYDIFQETNPAQRSKEIANERL